MDLLDALSSMVRADNLPLESAFQCSVAAMRTLRGPGASLQMDDSEYIAHIYKLLPRLVSCNLKLQEKVVPAAMEALREGNKNNFSTKKNANHVYENCRFGHFYFLFFFFASILFFHLVLSLYLSSILKTLKNKISFF